MAAPPYNETPSPEMARRIARVRLAKVMGWTLEYVDSLSPFDIADIWGVLDGESKVEQRRK